MASLAQTKRLAVVAIFCLTCLGCGPDARIVEAQRFAISRAVESNRMHNALHSKEQDAYGLAKMNEAQRLYDLSIEQAVQDAEADAAITKRQLAEEVVKRTATRDVNLAKVSAAKDLMKKAQSEANKPLADAVEAAGLVLQYEEADPGWQSLMDAIPTPTEGK